MTISRHVGQYRDKNHVYVFTEKGPNKVEMKVYNFAGKRIGKRIVPPQFLRKWSRVRRYPGACLAAQKVVHRLLNTGHRPSINATNCFVHEGIGPDSLLQCTKTWNVDNNIISFTELPDGILQLIDDKGNIHNYDPNDGFKKLKTETIENVTGCQIKSLDSKNIIYLPGGHISARIDYSLDYYFMIGKEKMKLNGLYHFFPLSNGLIISHAKEDEPLFVLDPKQKYKSLQQIKLPFNHVCDYFELPEGKLVVNGAKGEVALLDINDKFIPLRQFKLGNASWDQALVLSNGNIALSYETEIWIVSPDEDFHCIQKADVFPLDHGEILELIALKNGSLISVREDSDLLSFWDSSKNYQLFTLDVDINLIKAFCSEQWITVSRGESEYLIIANEEDGSDSYDGHLHVFETENFKRIQTINDHGWDSIISMSDGRLIACVGDCVSVYHWAPEQKEIKLSEEFLQYLGALKENPFLGKIYDYFNTSIGLPGDSQEDRNKKTLSLVEDVVKHHPGETLHLEMLIQVQKAIGNRREVGRKSLVLGQLYLDRNDPKKAQRVFEEALKLEPTNLGLCQALEKIYKTNAERIEPYRRCLLALVRTGRINEAMKVVKNLHRLKVEQSLFGQYPEFQLILASAGKEKAIQFLETLASKYKGIKSRQKDCIRCYKWLLGLQRSSKYFDQIVSVYEGLNQNKKSKEWIKKWVNWLIDSNKMKASLHVFFLKSLDRVIVSKDWDLAVKRALILFKGPLKPEALDRFMTIYVQGDKDLLNEVKVKLLEKAVVEGYKAVVAKLLWSGMQVNGQLYKRAHPTIKAFLDYGKEKHSIYHNQGSKDLNFLIEDEALSSDEESSDEEYDEFVCINEELPRKDLLYRGIHFSPQYFTSEKRAQVKDPSNHGTAYSRATMDLVNNKKYTWAGNYKKADSYVKSWFEGLKITPDRAERDDNGKVIKRKISGEEKDDFETRFVRFVQAYVMTYNNLFNKGGMTENYNFPLNKNPMLSTSKDALISLKYASGEYIVNDQTFILKVRKSNGSIKHRRLGYLEVYAIELDYLDLYSVPVDHFIEQEKIGVSYVYKHGKEVIIVSSIPKKYLVGFLPFSLPKMRDPWTSGFMTQYGLSKIVYQSFQKRLKVAARGSGVKKVLKALSSKICEHQSKQLAAQLKKRIIRKQPVKKAIDQKIGPRERLGERPKNGPLQPDGTWYSNDDINALFKHYFDNEEDVEVLTVQTYIILKDNLSEFSKARFNAIRTNKKVKFQLLIPLHINGNHWVVLYIRLERDATKPHHVTYIDPKGNPAPDWLVKMIKDSNLLATCEIISPNEKLQYNDNDCGPMIVEAARSLIESDSLPSEKFNCQSARLRHRKALGQKVGSPPILPMKPNKALKSVSDAVQKYVLPLYRAPYPNSKKREWHGVVHAMRTMLFSFIVAKLYAESGREVSCQLKSLLLAAALHDSGRKGDGPDRPEWEKKSGENCRTTLLKLGIPTEEARKLKSAIIEKDAKSPIDLETKIVHDADCIEYIRCCLSGKRKYDQKRLWLFKELGSKTAAQLVKEAMILIRLTERKSPKKRIDQADDPLSLLLKMIAVIHKKNQSLPLITRLLSKNEKGADPHQLLRQLAQGYAKDGLKSYPAGVAKDLYLSLRENIGNLRVVDGEVELQVFTRADDMTEGQDKAVSGLNFRRRSLVEGMKHLELNENVVTLKNMKKVLETFGVTQVNYEDLTGPNFDEEAAKSLFAALKDTLTVKRLSLNFSPFAISESHQALQHFTHLDLNLGDSLKSKEIDPVITWLKTNKTLQHLTVRCNIPALKAKEMGAVFAAHPALESLDFRGRSEAVIPLLEKNQNLKSLILRGGNNAFNGMGKALAKNTKLKHLTLDSTNRWIASELKEFAEAVGSNRSLESLTIQIPKLRGDALRWVMEALKKNTTLRKIVFLNKLQATYSQLWVALKNHKHLEELDVSCRPDKKGFSELATLIKSIPMKKLHLRVTGAEFWSKEEFLQIVKAVSESKTIVDLKLCCDGSQWVELLAKTLKGHPTLKRLGTASLLKISKLNETAAKAVAELIESCDQLQELDLGDIDVGSKEAVILANSLHNLRKLELGGEGIDDEGAVAFAKALESNQKMKTLRLPTDGSITKKGMEALEKMFVKNTTLTSHVFRAPMVFSKKIMECLKRNRHLALARDL